ncbi:MAG: hypothetical protein ACD_79C01283G0009 [uncultured bacterium]|nr:MAG: hypothetical protein ACD_79C01283G0009 [uncultured bacterium]
MKMIIHRGSHEIGGSCVELKGSSTRIFVDIGQPLDNRKVNLPDDIENCDGILISHPHADHYGLIGMIPDEVLLYCSSLTEKLIQASGIFSNKPALTNKFIHFTKWEKFQIGEFTITPYLMDHSSADSFAFLIQDNESALFYSGDLRATGRKSVLFKNILKTSFPEIDVLILEGSTMGFEPKEFPDEASVEMKMIEIMKNESGPCFLLCSSQNLDRLVSAFKAAIQSDRIFVVDIYTAWILQIFSSISENIPIIQWEKVKVLSKGFTAGNHYEVIKKHPEYFTSFSREIYKAENMITMNEIENNPNRYLIKTNYTEKLIKKLNINHSSLIYSMWSGYLTKEHNPKGYLQYEALKNEPSINFVYAHTSGHAYVKDLKKLAKALNPKMLVPIHTEHSEEYPKHFDNVHFLLDGQELNF